MGFKYNIPKYSILSEKDINTINDISLGILKNIGVKVPHDEILNMLYELGVNIDNKRQIAKFPEDLVLGSIKKS